MCHRITVLIDEGERTANFGLADPLCGLCYPLALHPLFFTLEVPHQADTGEHKQEAGFP